MTNCKHEKWVWSVVDGQLSEREEHEFLGHAEECEVCRFALDAAYRTRDALRSSHRYAAPTDFGAKTLERISHQLARKPSIWQRTAALFRRPTIALSSVAAFALVAYLGARPFLSIPEDGGPSQQAAQSYAEQCLTAHEQLGIETAFDPTASYIVTSGYTSQQ